MGIIHKCREGKEGIFVGAGYSEHRQTGKRKEKTNDTKIQ
jgi:hypothetical protein